MIAKAQALAKGGPLADGHVAGHETTPAALARNREGVAKWANLLDSASGDIKAHAESIGLKIDWNDLSSTVSPFASITQIPRAFDFESSHWPSRFHHTGPFHDGKSREKVDFPWERLTIQPPSSPYQKMNGLYMMPRTIDKMRAQLSGGKTGATA